MYEITDGSNTVQFHRDTYWDDELVKSRKRRVMKPTLSGDMVIETITPPRAYSNMTLQVPLIDRVAIRKLESIRDGDIIATITYDLNEESIISDCIILEDGLSDLKPVIPNGRPDSFESPGLYAGTIKLMLLNQT